MASTASDSHNCSSKGRQDLYSFTPVGYMESCFKTKNGTPRQPSVCSFARARLKILKSVFQRPDHSLEGLQEFSHVWIIYVFHQNNNKSFTKAKVRPPRLNGEKTGVFACRSPYRPNPIGMTLARLEAIKGDTLHLSGVDIIDGTPVLDIKPFIPSYDDVPAVPPTHDRLIAGGGGTNRGNVENAQSVNDCDFRNTSVEAGDHAATDVAPVRDEPSLDRRQLVVSIGDDSINLPSDSKDDVGASDRHGMESLNSGAKADSPDLTDTCTKSGASRCAAGEHTPKSEELLVAKPVHGGITCTPGSGAEHQSVDSPALGTKLDRAGGGDNSTTQRHVATYDTVDISREEGTERGGGRGQRGDCDCLADPPEITDEITDGVHVGDWVSSPPIDKLQVRFTPSASEDVQRFVGAESENSPKDHFRLEFFRSADELKEGIVSILAADPRSTYRRTSCSDRLYYFPLDSVHITCWFPEGCAEVLQVQPLSWADIPTKK